jgi:RNA polymerase sigma factor for flagellar operon FliA
VLKYRPYVYRVAAEMYCCAPAGVTFDDVVSWGTMGLVEAAGRFDPARGAQFRTYAHLRIKGAILDGIRREFGGEFPTTGRQRVASRVQSEAGAWLMPSRPRAGLNRSRLLAMNFHKVEPEFSHLWKKEIGERLGWALSRLAPEERDLIARHYGREVPLRVIAEAEGGSASSMSRRHSRALRRLRLILLGRYPDAREW